MNRPIGFCIIHAQQSCLSLFFNSVTHSDFTFRKFNFDALRNNVFYYCAHCPYIFAQYIPRVFGSLIIRYYTFVYCTYSRRNNNEFCGGTIYYIRRHVLFSIAFDTLVQFINYTVGRGELFDEHLSIS